MGVSFGAASIAGAFWIIIRQVVWGYSPVGWSSVMVSLAFTTGILLGSIGIAGLYISQIFEEVKERPNSIIWLTTRDKNS
jgi:hypothetical protein